MPWFCTSLGRHLQREYGQEPQVAFTMPILVAVMVDSGLASSGSEARRFIQQSGVRIDGETAQSIDLALLEKKAHVLQVGRRKFARIDVA